MTRIRRFLLGVGSLFDLQGLRTYERLRQEMPTVERRSLASSMRTAAGYWAPVPKASGKYLFIARKLGANNPFIATSTPPSDAGGVGGR